MFVFISFHIYSVVFEKILLDDYNQYFSYISYSIFRHLFFLYLIFLHLSFLCLFFLHLSFLYLTFLYLLPLYYNTRKIFYTPLSV